MIKDNTLNMDIATGFQKIGKMFVYSYVRALYGVLFCCTKREKLCMARKSSWLVFLACLFLVVFWWLLSLSGSDTDGGGMADVEIRMEQAGESNERARS